MDRERPPVQTVKELFATSQAVRNWRDSWGPVPSDNRTERKRLFRRIPAATDYRQFRYDLYRISHELHKSLFERRRLNNDAKREVHRSLVEVAKAIDNAAQALGSLGKEALGALHKKAQSGRSEVWTLFEPRPLTDPVSGVRWRASGQSRVETVGQMISMLQAWAAAAGDAEPLPGPGQPDVSEARVAVQQLIGLWTTQTGKIGGRGTDYQSGKRKGPFLDFCREVIAPIYESFGLKVPSIGQLVHEEVGLARRPG